MWIYTRHDLSTQPWDASAAIPMDSPTSGQLSQDFGIDRQKVQRWRETYNRRFETDPPAEHQGCDASAQYDRIFRIAALNRQIEVLKRRMVVDTVVSSDETLDEMIARCESQRALLIEMLRASGRNADG